MKAKDKHRHNLLLYLGNPENDFPTRLSMSTDVLGFKNPSHIYRVFTLDELSEIESEALEIRRKKYKPELAKVDRELFKKAQDGDVSAIKLCYQKFEDWAEKKRQEHTGKDGEPIEHIHSTKGMDIQALKDAITKAET